MIRSFVHGCGRALLVVGAAVGLSFCGGGGGSGSGGGPTVPVQPTAAPTPTPSPTADPPLSASCARIGPGVANAECRTDAPTFMDDMNEAIDTLQVERPDIFDGNQVLNVGAYYVDLIRILDRKGICGGTDGEEFGVKINNDYNDIFDVLTSKNEVRRFYVGTCFPAQFPAAAVPLPPPPAGCNLPSSTFIACGRPPEGQYYNDVAAAIDQMLKEKPELFDYSDINPGTDWPRVKDPEAYQNGVVAILIAKGYCAIFDGEEITIKKTNEFTEHYDVNYADHYIRTGPGIFRGSCYPAAF
jgi:hypothetical protein